MRRGSSFDDDENDPVQAVFSLGVAAALGVGDGAAGCGAGEVATVGAGIGVLA